MSERSRQVSAMRAEQALYDFRELHSWYQQVVSAVVSTVDGITMTDIDDRHNRITIGVIDSRLIDPVRAALAQLEVPAGAVVVKQFDPIEIEPPETELICPEVLTRGHEQVLPKCGGGGGGGGGGGTQTS